MKSPKENTNNKNRRNKKFIQLINRKYNTYQKPTHVMTRKWNQKMSQWMKRKKSKLRWRRRMTSKNKKRNKNKNNKRMMKQKY